MKPTYGIEVNLEYNARQLSTAMGSLKKIRHKLRSSELVLNDQPSKEEAGAMSEWKRKVHDLLEVHEKLPFPSFAEVRAEFDEKSRIQAEKEEKKMSALKTFSIAPKTLEALKKSRETKRFGPCNFQFGPKPDGEVITEIKGYSGGNSYYRGSRTIIRKDHLGSALTGRGGAPPWMGPQYYENTDPKVLKPNHSASIDLGSTRQKKTALEYKKEKLLHRSWSPHTHHQSPSPSYQQDSFCVREEHQYSTPFEDLVPYSRESARSTMGVRTPLSGGLAPRNITLGEKSMIQQMVGDGHGGTIALDLEIAAGTSSLQTKISRLGERVYQVSDYTMDGLALQAKSTNTYLTEAFIPDEEDDLFSAGSGNKFNDVSKLIDDRSLGSREDATLQSVGSDTMSGLSVDLFRVSNVDQAISDMAEIHGFSPVDLNQDSIGKQREKNAEISMVDFRENTVEQFINYTREYRSRQASRRKRAVMITENIPPLTEDMRAPIQKWFKQHNIYTPAKPQTIRYLKEHKSSAAVSVEGLMLPADENPHNKSQIEDMISDLSIPSSYFALPLDMVGEPDEATAFTRVPTTHSPHKEPRSLVGTRYSRSRTAALTPLSRSMSLNSTGESSKLLKRNSSDGDVVTSATANLSTLNLGDDTNQNNDEKKKHGKKSKHGKTKLATLASDDAPIVETQEPVKETGPDGVDTTNVTNTLELELVVPEATQPTEVELPLTTDESDVKEDLQVTDHEAPLVDDDLPISPLPDIAVNQDDAPMETDETSNVGEEENDNGSLQSQGTSDSLTSKSKGGKHKKEKSKKKKKS